MRTVLTHCTILTDAGRQTDMSISLSEGKIESIEHGDQVGDSIIDCQGMIVTPGAIDAHVHTRDPGLTQKEDFSHVGQAAAHGGVTTLCDIQSTTPPTVSASALDGKRAAAKNCAIRTAFFICATPDNVSLIDSLRADDVAGVKIYLAESIGSIVGTYDLLKLALQQFNGVVAIHAEDNTCIAGVSAPTPQHSADYLNTRPSACAEIAVSRAIECLEEVGGKLHICHVTTAEEAALIRDAKKKGLNISAEVTPHHLTMTAEECVSLGARAKVNPPLRTKHDVDALWAGLVDGTIDIIATDHAPHTLDEKALSFSEAPAGMPGIETMIPVVLTEGSLRSVPLERIIHAFSGAPAQRYGFNTRGQLAPGMDADITIIDPANERTVNAANLHSKCGWSPFEGRSYAYWPVCTIVQGEVVYNTLTT